MLFNKLRGVLLDARRQLAEFVMDPDGLVRCGKALNEVVSLAAELGLPEAQLCNRRVYDLVCSALAKAIPDRMPAAGEGGVSMMVFTATNGAQRPTMMTEMYASGWGGRPIGDGIEGVMPSFMTGFRANSGEAFESELPVMLDGFGFRARYRRGG